MKTIYKSILFLALSPLAITAFAQSAAKDTTLSRQVLLEREYTPILKDASKINTLPAVYEPVIKQKQIKFIDKAPQLSFVNNQLGKVPSGDMKTDILSDTKRGYFNMAAGTNSNLDAALGYRIVDTNTDRLDIFATHLSSSSTVDYIQKEFLYTDAKAKYADSKINLGYAHTFDASILSVKSSYMNTAYNYYGNSFWSTNPDYPYVYNFDMDSKQQVDVFSFGAGLKSSENNAGALKYDVFANYSNFKNKYGPLLVDKGAKGGQIDINANFYTTFDADKIMGIKGYIMNQSFSTPAFAEINTIPNAFHSYTNITAAPYVKMEGDVWSATLGLDVSALFDIKKSFQISPNIEVDYRLADKTLAYAAIKGGVNNNTFLDILQENRYVNPATRVDYSKTMYDLSIGVKSGIVSGFEFDVFAGYKSTKKDHLYMTTTNNDYSWGNVGTPIYANVKTGHAGALLKTSLIPYTNLSAKLTGYFYNVKYEESYLMDVSQVAFLTEQKAWGRPSMTAELNADVTNVIPKLTLSVNYLYAGGRKNVYMNTTTGLAAFPMRMKDINELNFKAEYKITDWVSANVRLNNVLFQKYEMVYGYPLQGFNVLGGLNLKF